jgi:hypothetical protein
MVFSISDSGGFRNTERFLNAALKINLSDLLQTCGKEGVAALALATPMDTGLAAHSWDFHISTAGGIYTITWTNTDVENGFPVAIALQYGYGTGTGGYVQGVDYINPAIRPVFDRIAQLLWKAVTSA